jgi:hypothetical protein
LAADNGIDLNQLGDEQIAELWDGTFGKTAGDDKDEDDKKGRRASEDDDEDDKSKKAAAEFYAVKEAHDKVAEADYLGRVMAHSFTNEMEGIKEATFRETAGKAGTYLSDKGKALGGYAAEKGKRFPGVEDIGEGASALRRAKDHPSGSEGRKLMALEGAKRLAKGVGKAGGTVSVAGGAVYGGKKLLDKRQDAGDAEAGKTASALDVEAAEYAFQKAAEAGWDVNEASERLTAVLTLGPLESEKIASASTYGEALEVRSLELLAQAGYPVQWA